MSSDVAQKKGEKAFAFAALLWSLSTLALASLLLVHASSTDPSSFGLLAMLTSGGLFALTLGTGVRSRFVLGRTSESTRLRLLSGGLSVGCFLFGWSVIAIAYARGGDSAAHSAIRHGMPTTMGISFGVLSAASLSLFLWECIAAVSEIRGAVSKRSFVLATVLSMTMAFICVAALSGVVVGEMFFFGDS